MKFITASISIFLAVSIFQIINCSNLQPQQQMANKQGIEKITSTISGIISKQEQLNNNAFEGTILATALFQDNPKQANPATVIGNNDDYSSYSQVRELLATQNNNKREEKLSDNPQSMKQLPQVDEYDQSGASNTPKFPIAGITKFAEEETTSSDDSIKGIAVAILVLLILLILAIIGVSIAAFVLKKCPFQKKRGQVNTTNNSSAQEQPKVPGTEMTSFTPDFSKLTQLTPEQQMMIQMQSMQMNPLAMSTQPLPMQMPPLGLQQMQTNPMMMQQLPPITGAGMPMMNQGINPQLLAFHQMKK